MKTSHLPHSELAHSYMGGVPILEQITISQVYLGHISLCMSVRAERASLEDLQLMGQEGCWLWKNSCQRMQKRGQDLVKSQCTQALWKTVQESSEILHNGSKHRPFMKQEVYNNTCTAINHVGDTTKDSSDLVQWDPVGAVNPNS